MSNLLLKELRLSASPIAYFFTLFGLMFFIPGYPILCGAFFPALGIYKSFDYAREANDTMFSALLPMAKRDVVKGRYCFVCLIELTALLIMAVSMIVRMTLLGDLPAYSSNFMMNADPFALGAAFLLFGLFNLIFVGGFYRTGYKTGRPFLAYIIVVFPCIGVFETLHHIPGLQWLDEYTGEHMGSQLILLLCGAASYVLLTLVSYRKAARNFEKIDL